MALTPAQIFSRITSRPVAVVAALSLFFLLSCRPPLTPPPVLHPGEVPVPPPPAHDCILEPLPHEAFTIFVDGKEVGLEVRSRRVEQGPFGLEDVRLSHSVMRMRLGTAMIEHTQVRSERLLANSGKLLHGSMVRQDQVSASIHLVGWDGDGWQRLVEKRNSVLSPVASEPEPLELLGTEVVGLSLLDVLARTAALQGGAVTQQPLAYYEPALPAPVSLSLGEPLAGRIDIDGHPIDGTIVEAYRADDGVLMLSAFFDEHGRLWEERYPTLGEVRRRLPGSPSLSFETSELLVGLRSSAYLGMPDSARRAVFSLQIAADRMAVLEPLGEPVNQTLTRVADDELRLDVSAGAPDGNQPVLPDDLGSCRFIRPNAPEIRDALWYLRFAGKRGSLPALRADNATPVIARAALIGDPRSFWRDPDRVARLMMSYVSALLPDKRHTFSMADAPTALRQGAGDCTEHAVLFASLMRAHGVPTRLVAGLYLTRGGLWGYHLWNAYWNGTRWQSIDPGNMVHRPGALYVSFSRGVSRFDDLRSDLARLIENTFRGASFELLEAYAEGGERMILSRPRKTGQGLPETALFNALVLAGRGDHAAALEALESAIDDSIGSLRLSLMRIQLMVAAGRYAAALEEIAAFRRRSSAGEHLHLLDLLELDALLSLGRKEDSRPALARLSERLADDPARLALVRSRFLRHTGAKDEALALLRAAIADDPDDPGLRIAFAQTVASLSGSPGDELLVEALDHGRQGLLLTLSADPAALSAMAALLFRAGRHAAAGLFVEHGLVLAPAARDLLDLRDRLRLDRCAD